MSGERSLGEELLFQPKGSLINSVGGSAMDSLVTLLEGDTLEKHSVDLPAGVELGVVEPFDENILFPRMALVHECWWMGPVAMTKHVLVGWWSCLICERVTAH